jgi:hypothetical protein
MIRFSNVVCGWGFTPALLGVSLIAACSSDPPARQGTNGSAAGGWAQAAAGTNAAAPSGSSSAGIGDNPTTIAAGPNMTMTGAAGSGGAPVDGCVGTSATAPPPANPQVDIIWIVDASGSMLDEQMKIGQNLATFADDITKANLDVHIVMMTTTAAIPVICPVTPDDPLANSPLATDPRYKFIDTRVDSHNALDIAHDNYAMYSSFLRPAASTQFVVVSDDESTYKGGASADARASAFHTDMVGLLGHEFTLHTVASDGPTACGDPNCMPDVSTGICVFVMLGCGAAAPGTTYYDLAAQTHGITASICESDWNNVFAPLTAAVIASAPLPCNYAIPKAPTGESLDPSQVNVHWQSTTAPGDMLFGKTVNQAACQTQLGWYYDDDTKPTQVLLCPSSCSQVASGGTLSIGFGCATIELK